MRVLLSLLVLTSPAAAGLVPSDCLQQRVSVAAGLARQQDTLALQQMITSTACPALRDSWQEAYLSGYLNYRLAEALIGSSRKQADKPLKQAINQFERSVELANDCAICHAMLSSAYGLMIGLHPMRGMFLGPKAGRSMKTAQEIEPDNRVVNLLDGIGKLNTPRMFGGGTDKAAALLKTSLDAYTGQTESWGWGPAEVNFWYGMGLIRAGNADGRVFLARALEIAPGYIQAQLAIAPSQH